MSDPISDMIVRVLDKVNAIGAANPGWTRPSYSDEETSAHDVIEEEATRLGLKVWRDAGSNLFARLPGRDPNLPPLYTGSHLDTVPSGGAYDGVAGVAGAMGLIAHYAARNELPPCDLIVTVIRAEESVWFPASYIGSRAALGRLAPDEMSLCRADTGRTLAGHMRDQGADPAAVLAGPGLGPARFLEMHIEQGPILHDSGHAFAAVSGIRGSLRYRSARIAGTWGHSGGVPRHLRSDTVFALSDVISALDAAWAETEARGEDLAVTVGRVDAASADHAFAKVPGEVAFCLDMRSNSTEVLDAMNARLMQVAAKVEAERGVRFDFGPQTRSRPASLHPGMMQALAAPYGNNAPAIASGGGHDAAAFASAGWQSGMVFLRNWNGSHTPDEGMDPKDLAEAVRHVAAALSTDPYFTLPQQARADQAG